MQLAICNETFGDMPLEEAVQLAASLGYRGWEVAPFMLAESADKFSDAQRREYRRVVNAAGLEIVGLHWLLAKTEGFHLTTDDAETRKRTAEYFKHLIRLCADLCEDSAAEPVMVLGSPQQRNRAPHITTEAAHEHAADVLGRLHESLEQAGVKIALEPLGPTEGNFLNTADEARMLWEKIHCPHIGLHLDVKAMSTEPEDIPTIVRNHAHWLLHFHANDPNLLGPGMGDVDFLPIIAALREVGYNRWVSVEVFDYSPGPRRIAEESIRTLQRALEATA